MITNFCDLYQFSAKKLASFSKNQCYDQYFSKTSSSLSKKRQYFLQFFGENIFKSTTSVPGHPALQVDFVSLMRFLFFVLLISRHGH
jgi:hypothetical protein